MKVLIEFLEVLAWPTTVLVLALLFRHQIAEFLRRVRKADLPGGVSVETFPEEIREARALSSKVKEEQKARKASKTNKAAIPLTEANARMLNLGYAPSPSGLELSQYGILAERDPNLALAGLRIEAEIMLKNLAKGFKVSIRNRDSAAVIVRKLKEHDAITSQQSELLSILLRLSNSAVHGVKVTETQVEEILEIGSVLRDQYVSWLSWGFEDDWQPSEGAKDN